MRRLFLLLLSCILGGSLYAQAPRPLGMVLQTSGDVVVQRGKEKKPVKLADLVFDGDQILTQTGQTAFLFCPSSERVSLKAGSSVQLSDKGLKVVKGPAPLTHKVGRCVLPQIALGSESLERVGALRGRGYAPIPQFVGGAITTARPRLEWGAIADAEIYQVTLRSENGATVWQQRTTGLFLDYPESKPALQDKPYQWEVRAEKEGKIIALQTANIEVKANTELSQRTALDAADRLLLATELENAGYYAEAARLFRLLRESAPEDQRLTQHLAWLYWNAGLITATNEERAKLKQ